ncbi:penicillin acylase family protein [Shewanella psychropiezotolerans]|uniref:Penicillin acylase family protein n=1 Tax=Shewanella psychropiezotolerans TaxID=2593655 RepID=A0ABX5X1G7_9GAMM|nr:MULTISPECIES: penicillin acylase family protein [Shewanella]MPY21163.1 penicillin acylase family protein [Shewanella sp. YLB-07]MPY21950.1 penicillin acylase family protein [Shewanella sp. YLB-07]QDO85169.1 penicillin acylase family protein [Shewanella psychropiezotolerans]
MTKIIKILLVSTLSLIFILISTAYLGLHLSLPKLSGEFRSGHLFESVTIERDRLGTAVIHGQNRRDVAYALGFAHGQDRFFQMDLLRRNSAGELAELFGEKALNLDKSRRFHQLRKRAENTVAKMEPNQKLLLQAYANGVNAAVAEQSLSSFEYLLTGASPQTWQPADSLLVIYSMYLDLQGNTPKRDMALTQIQRLYGEQMLAFVTQHSPYQAALDSSLLPTEDISTPELEPQLLATALISTIEEPIDIGSNNWAVTGALTESGRAMLSDDMHLSFAVPIIWYRAQLNYVSDTGEPIQVTGVSLPGAPAIVVGTNNRVAWGFTNAYIDTADWIAIDENEPLSTEIELMKLPGSQSNVEYPIQLSQFGPVKHVNGQDYALSWVAHQGYAVDMELMGLETAVSVQEGLALATTFGIPVQNLMLVDSEGNAAWKPAGAVPSRTNPANVAQLPETFQGALWGIDERELPQVVNPEHGRLWSANSRVISAEQFSRFGDGGYALGARSQQIRDRLFESEQFTEQDFYRLQLDNEAKFLTPWHDYLINLLSLEPVRFAKDIQFIRDWQACACADSVGYTLVRSFRAKLIDAGFAPIETGLNEINVSLSPVKRYLEPAMWQLLEDEPDSWLPEQYSSWDQFAIQAYVDSTQELLSKHSDEGALADLNWGKVNALKIQHPFSKQMPLLSALLDMPTVIGFGDSFMPAVQRSTFGASQRFIVQPGLESQAIMVIPGGQSGHPLSDYYRAGFDEYANHESTPLLPGVILHKIIIQAI